jgi:hypothetical protein
MNGFYCNNSDASFDTGPGAGNEGDLAFAGCVADGYNIINGGFNIIDYCS